jgi:hypothetical protein
MRNGRDGRQSAGRWLKHTRFAMTKCGVVSDFAWPKRDHEGSEAAEAYHLAIGRRPESEHPLPDLSAPRHAFSPVAIARRTSPGLLDQYILCHNFCILQQRVSMARSR